MKSFCISLSPHFAMVKGLIAPWLTYCERLLFVTHRFAPQIGLRPKIWPWRAEGLRPPFYFRNIEKRGGLGFGYVLPSCGYWALRQNSGKRYSQYIEGVGQHAHKHEVEQVVDKNLPAWAKNGVDFFSPSIFILWPHLPYLRSASPNSLTLLN